MTAAEKRAESVNRFKKLFALAIPDSPWGTMTPHIEHCLELVPFTDDEPAATADWRDQAVALGTGWGHIPGSPGWVQRRVAEDDLIFDVRSDGVVEVNDNSLAPANNDPLARCIAIDDFLNKLGVRA